MANDAATAPRGSPSAWRIDRFDLIFYNARHKRWQFFAEDPLAGTVGERAEGEGLHRYQIRNLLSTFRQAVQSVLSGPTSERNVFEIRSYDKGTADEHIQLSRPEFAEWRDYERVYLDYLISTGWFDGVPDSHRQDLQKWFDNPTESVPRDAALTFLSLLPIFEDWDTWGCFIRCRKAAGPSFVDSFPPAQASAWADPLYVVELDFRNSELHAASATKSRQLLGYPVSIEGLSLNLGADRLVPVPSARADFFDARYCKYPTGDEVIPYRFYAALVDPIMKGLVGEPEQRQFVIAYPLATGGRLHFLQVALSTSADATGACVRGLWDDWLAVHRDLWRPTFRSFLQEEIYRIGASAFQSEVHDKFADEIKNKGNLSTQHYAHALHEHIYHLFPLHEVTTSHGAWHYAWYRFPKKEWGHPLYDPNRLLLVGSEWKANQPEDETQEPLPRPIRTIEVAGAEITISSKSADAINSLVDDHRIRQAVEQQNQFLSWLPEGLHKAKLDADHDRQLCLRIVVEYGRRLLARRGERAFDPTSPDFTHLINEPIDLSALSPGTKGPEGREPYSSRYYPKSFGRYLTEAFNEELPARQIAALIRILRPPLLLQLSEYFETGPAKIASHNGYKNYFRSNKAQDLREAMTVHYNPLYQSITDKLNAHPTLADAVKSAISLNDFHTRLTTSVTKTKTVSDLYVKGGDLIKQHNAFRIRELGTYADLTNRDRHGFRSYWLDPMIVLNPLLLAIKSRSADYLSKAAYSRRLRETDSYTNDWMPENGHPVKMLEHFISFGTIHEVTNLDEFATGEVCQEWTSAQQAIAGLLLHTQKATYVFHDQRFTGDSVLHERLLGDPVSGGLFEQGAKSCLVIMLQVWRTVETEATRARWMEEYTEECDI